jgi:predicted NBD/HSP70 family sugar kinase
VQLIAQTADQLLEVVQADFGSRRVAVGIQVGGPVDTEAGVVLYLRTPLPNRAQTPAFRWMDVPLGRLVTQATGLASLLMNDADALAERELWWGVGQSTDNYTLLLLRETLEASIVRGGEQFKGPVEIGHLVIDFKTPERGATGSSTLESLGGTTAILRASAESTTGETPRIEDAVELIQQQGGSADLTPFRTAGVAVANALSNLIALTGPSPVVLCGSPALLERGQRAADAFIGSVERFREYLPFEQHRQSDMIYRPLHSYDGADGAALMVLRRHFDVMPPNLPQPSVDT